MAPSSPATASSHATASSDALSSLTRGTTAATSPAPMSPKSAAGASASSSASASRSPSLSPAPEEPPKAGTKRKVAARASDASTPAKKKTKAAAAAPAKGTKAAAAKKGGAKATTAAKKKVVADEKPEKGTFCHQCRTRCEPENVLRCTKLRKYTKGTPARACNLAWCERDLMKRYAVDPDAVRERGHDVDEGTAELHDADKPYVFACPCCEDTCQNSTCRQRKGLAALGDIVKLAAQQGVTPLELVAQADAEGPTPTAKSRPQASELFDGDLSDPDAPPKKKKAAAPKKAAAAAPAKGKKATPKKDTKNGKTAATKTATKAGKKDSRAAAEKSAAKGKAAKDKPKAITRIVWPKTDAPAIRNVDTRLGREEAEQRMYLREFLCRFRGILNIPDRALGPLDDFDHPLSEATVRQMASALLGAVISDGGACLGMSVWNLDVIEDLREELRYADLSRFVQIFRQLEDELYGLRLPPDPTKEAKKRNEAAMRALLDLGADEPAPSWATDTGPSRRGRASASRLPQPSEVVRMLIGIADVVANLDEVRFHMDPKVLYSDSDAIRKLSQLHKKEATRWAEEKKKLNQARLLGKSGPGNKAAKARARAYEEAEEETNLRHRFYDLNYRTVAARKALRFEPLGTDLDGRVYYSLTPRLIDEERYRPSGWARGVFIWGRGWDQEDDDVPSIVERWMVVSSAKDVRQLADHIHWRLRIKEDEMAEEAAKGGGKQAPAPVPAAVEKTPSKMPNGRAKLANGKAKTALANGGGGDDDGASDAGSDDSELSAAPTEEYDDLFEHLNPPGYVPDAGTISHQQFALFMNLTEVAIFLRALEWKGH